MTSLAAHAFVIVDHRDAETGEVSPVRQPTGVLRLTDVEAMTLNRALVQTALRIYPVAPDWPRVDNFTVKVRP